MSASAEMQSKAKQQNNSPATLLSLCLPVSVIHSNLDIDTDSRVYNTLEGDSLPLCKISQLLSQFASQQEIAAAIVRWEHGGDPRK